jgi:adenosylcobinamide kinase/adenosylcobinamide-phosphate guanylyltransferase
MRSLITGGARSGKSVFAERYASALGKHGLYVATSHLYDREMEERIKHHRLRREEGSFLWRTIEEPYDLAGVLERCGQGTPGGDSPVLLIDCLTLWLSNWILKDECSVKLDKLSNELAAAVSAYPGPLLLVTNEVGSGIVPEYALGRKFRDVSGRLNQMLAQACDQVFLVTAGIPVELKSIAFSFPSKKG